MKILFVTCRNPHFLTITEYIEWAIRDCGHKSVFFDDRAFLLPGRLRDRAPFLQNWDLKRINSNLITTAKCEKPDLVLVAGGYRILPDTVRELKASGFKTALWTIDPPPHPVLMAAAPFYDYRFCGGSEMTDRFDKLGLVSTLLPFGYAEGYHKKFQGPESELADLRCDICFIGSYYPSRAKVYESLADQNFRIYGPGWENLPNNSPLKKLASGGQVKPDFWMRAYAASKIVLCAHLRTPEFACHQASPRVYEALATESFLLCDDERDVKTLFSENAELAIYKDGADLRGKALYYLAHDEKRRKIAAAGLSAVREKHSYRHRIETLLAAVTNQS